MAMISRATMIFLVVVGVVACDALCNERTDDPLGVAVSPQTMLLSSYQGGKVVVHTAIKLTTVDRATVELDGIPAVSTWADSRGNLVAGFNEEDVKAIVAPPESTLTLTGLLKDGTPFAGSDTIRVVP